MDKQYSFGDIIEYLGVRYYVLGVSDDGTSWECINGYTFDICQVPKSKITEYIGRSKINFDVMWVKVDEGK